MGKVEIRLAALGPEGLHRRHCTHETGLEGAPKLI